MLSLRASISIIHFVVGKSFSGSFELAKDWYVSGDVIFFQTFKPLTTAVTSVSQYFLYPNPGRRRLSSVFSSNDGRHWLSFLSA
jgi:hypothetical protein